MSTPSRATLHPEVRIVDQTRGIVDYVASDETLDSYQEIIRADGWRFTLFARNSPFVDSHDTWNIRNLVGRVTDYRVQERQLIERVQWAVDVPSNELARLGFDMTSKGYLRAVSVGFWPEHMVFRSDTKAFAAQVKDLGLDEEAAARLRAVHVRQQQVELSAVILGANPNALVKAYHDGALRDEDLHRLGFDSDAAWDAITRSAVAWESPACDDAFRAMHHVFMARLYHSRPSADGASAPPDSPGTPRAAAAESSTRRDLEAFLGKLRELGNQL